jgi:hypothetical protein
MLPIVIPFHKNRKQLATCQEALNCQSFKDIEVEVVDDSETENGFTRWC